MMKKNESTGRGRTNGIYQVTKDECERCVRDALEVGYRSIDTAQSYFNEEEVGKAIEKSGIDRKEIFLTSKVWIEHFGYEECKKSVLESVEKLRTDYLDLMLLHRRLVILTAHGVLWKNCTKKENSMQSVSPIIIQTAW